LEQRRRAKILQYEGGTFFSLLWELSGSCNVIINARNSWSGAGRTAHIVRSRPQRSKQGMEMTRVGHDLIGNGLFENFFAPGRY
jgi:hypothetical protein